MDEDLGLVPVSGSQPSQEDLGLVPVEPDMSATRALVKSNVAAEKAKRTTIDASAKPVPAEDWLDSLAAGWGFSVSGLAGRGQSSDIVNPEHAGTVMEVASQVGQLAGDLPAMVAGGALGGIAGAAAGTATVPVLGTVGGAAVGADVGAFALPQAMRKIMMDHYEKGDIQTAGEFWNRLSSTTWETLKAGTVGAVSMGTGRIVGPLAGEVGGKVVGSLAKTASEIGTMVSVGSALEGKLPNASDFTNAGIVIGGIAGSLHVAGKLRGVFSATGELPAAAVEKINSDVVLKQDVLSINPDKPVEVTKPAEPVDVKPGTEKPSTWVDAYNKVSDTYHRSMDDLASIKIIRDKLNKGEPLAAGEDPYILARGFGGIENKAQHFENFGTLDFKTGEKNGEGLKSIIKDLPDKTGTEYSEAEKTVLSRVAPEDLAGKNETWGKATAYRLAKRVIEREAQGKQTGVDVDAAKVVVKEGKAEYEAVSQRMQAYESRALKYLADSGAIGKAEEKAIHRMSKEYVPLARLLEDDPFSVKPTGAGGPKRFKGSESLIRDPFETSQANVQAMIRAAEKNRLFKSLADVQIKADKDAPTLMQRKLSKQVPIAIKNNEIVKFLESHGFDTTDMPPDTLTIFRPRMENLAENEFMFKRDGKKEVWQVLPEYQDALRAINYDPGQTHILLKLMQFPAKTLRTLTAISPDFITRNAWRDQITATIQSKHGYVPIVNVLEGMKHLWNQDEVFQGFLSSGGLSGGLDSIDPFLKGGDLWSLNKDTGFMDKTWNNIKTPFKSALHGLEMASAIVENSPRIMEFKSAGGMGKDFNSKIKGGYAARTVTVDFQKSGETMRMFSKYVPFSNAGLQGTEAIVKAFTNGTTAEKTAVMAKAFALITIPSILTFLNGREDSRYKDAPNWQKNLFWVVPTNKWETAVSQQDFDSRPEDLKRKGSNGELQVNNGLVFRIPKPFEPGVLFGSLPERILESLYNKNPEAFKSFDETVIQALTPNMFPPALLGPMEQMMNHSIFHDSDLVSPQSEQMLPEERYGPHTSETAKQIAKLIGYTPLRSIGSKATPLNAPAVVDNYLSLWGGTGGKYIVELADGVLHAAGIGNTAPKPAWGWEDMPFARAFMMKSPNPRSQPINDFYERFNFATQAMNSYKESMKRGDTVRAQEIKDAYEPVMGRLTDVYKALGEANKALNWINRAPETGPSGQHYGPVEKRQMMTTIYYQMNEMAKSANGAMDKYQKTIEDRKKGK